MVPFPFSLFNLYMYLPIWIVSNLVYKQRAQGTAICGYLLSTLQNEASSEILMLFRKEKKGSYFYFSFGQHI